MDWDQGEGRDMTDREMWREAANEVMRLEGIRAQREELDAYRSAAHYDDAGTFLGWKFPQLDRAHMITVARGKWTHA